MPNAIRTRATRSWLSPRLSVLVPLVAGSGLFVAAIASSWSQPLGCAQPNPDACPLELDQPVAAVLEGDVLVHRWRFTVPEAPDGGGGATFAVTLPAPPADYDLYLATDDGRLVAQSTQDGPIDELIQLSGVAPGAYVALVVSPRCQTSRLPYVLLASTQMPSLAVVAPSSGGPTMPPDVATLLGSGLGVCGAAPAAGPAVNPYGAPPALTNPYEVPSP